MVIFNSYVRLPEGNVLVESLCDGSDAILDAMENPFLQMKFTECHPRLPVY